MPIPELAQIRNIALVGHGGSGKTSLAEALLFKAGATTRLGKVQDHSSILDYTEESKEKRSSLDSAVGYFHYKGLHVNFVDTPGTMAFTGPAIAALSAVETAILVISAHAGIQVNTRRMYERARELGLAVWIVINHIDAPNVDLPELFNQVKESFGMQCVPINLPTQGGKAVVDCFVNESGDVDMEDVGASHTALIESLVGDDETMMEKYLSGEVSKDDVEKIAAKAIAHGACVPVFFANSLGDVGVIQILEALSSFAPSPLTGMRRNLIEGEKKTPIEPKKEGPFIGHVFKITTDPKSHIKYLSVRVHTGRLTPDMTVKSLKDPKGTRPGHVLRMLGADHKEIEAASAGDIIALAKLDFHIGETLCTDKIGAIEMPKFPQPMFSLAVMSKSRGDEDKISQALRRFMDEDPCFLYERGTGGELIIRGMGETQLRSYLHRMHKHQKLDVDTKPPRIPYRETIVGKATDIEYTHKKQSGGSGQYGKVVINVVPNDRGAGYEFVDKIFGGAIDQAYRPSVDKGVRAQMAEGVLAGYPIVDVKVELTDGKTHPVDSKDIAFQIAGRGAFKEGFMKAKPVLLEPIVHVHVVVPADNVGDITGDLASRRGRPQGQEVLPGGLAIIDAVVPLAELADYNSRLSSITGGQGSFSMEFSHYEPVPSNLQQQIVDAHKKEVAEAHV